MAIVFAAPAVFGSVVLSGPTALVIGAAGLVVALAAGWASARLLFRESPTDPSMPRLIDGRILVADTRPADDRQGLSTTGDLDAFKADLGRLDTAAVQDLDRLIANGDPFRTFVRRPGAGHWHIDGRLNDMRPLVTIRAATRAETDMLGRLSDTASPRAQTQAFRARAEAFPVPAFEVDDTGAVLWQNDAFRQLFRTSLQFGGVRPEIPPGADGIVQLRASDGSSMGWVRVTGQQIPGGGRMSVIEDLNPQFEAEESLRSFMSTMTETFAHLDVGLAIFDRERRMSLFNPALSDIFGLKPTDLAMRPSLREFLEQLRANRMVPEQTNFTAWRRRFAEQASAADGSGYQEDWTLPSGSILRVTGRPHPRGAVAYIFEDISGHVMMVRRYLSEIALGQATLDHVSDGVSIFATTGDLVLMNAAFAQAFGLDQDQSSAPHTLETILGDISNAVSPDGPWQQVREFVLGDDRTDKMSWVLAPRSGPAREVSAVALPDGSTLLTVRDCMDTPKAVSVA